ncbi:MAG TPA: hypothetical protein VJ201_01635 [Candidatus Babeliales bacterium]|nr:hypothetical protein [Candidatus Babeliales bacterium]
MFNTIAKPKKGYLLVEIIFYIALSIVIISLIYFFWLEVTLATKRKQSQLSRLSHINAELDLFARDIQSAPHDFVHWKKCSLQEIIWKTKFHYDVGWRFHNNRLERVSGIYSKETNKWIKSNSNLALDSLANLKFIITKNISRRSEAISLVSIELLSDNMTKGVIKTVAIRNGVFQ